MTRDDALAVLARAFGDELLEPGRERMEPRRDEEGQLVRAPERCRTQDRPEKSAGVVGGGLDPAGGGHRRCR